MSREIVGSLLAAVAVVMLVGCASSGSSSGQIDTSRDVDEMKERILELQEQATMTKVELERLQDEVGNLQQRMAQAAAGPSLEVLVERPAEMPAREMGSEAISNTTEVVVEESDLGTERFGEAETLPSPQTTTAGEASLQPVEPAAQALYDRGYTLYHQGKYLDAEASFQRFLQAHPNTELSDNAQFWIGESRYARGDIQGAMAAFREVLQKYPQGNKVPDALIKEGDCLDRLGDKDGARDRFQEVQRRFPDTGAAVMAEDRLSKLDS